MNKEFKKLYVIKKTSDFRRAAKVGEVPLWSPLPSQVLVKVLYAGVNADDINASADKLQGFRIIPFEVGLEALGVVQEIGELVTTFKVGQIVAYYSSNNYGYAEYIYASVAELVPVPSLDPKYLGLLHSGLAARIGLDKLGQIKQGDKVVITAAAGGVGQMAVQWAKEKGCFVVAMTSSPEKAELLKKLGADMVTLYKTEDWDHLYTVQIMGGFDVIWETVGGQLFESLMKHLGDNGRMVMAGRTSVYKEDVVPDLCIPGSIKALLKRNQTVLGFDVHYYSIRYKDQIKKYLDQSLEDYQSGKLIITLDMGEKTKEGPFVGIESVVRAVEHLNSGKSMGKVVVKIQNE